GRASPRRSRPASSCRSRCSSTWASGSRWTRAPASTSPGHDRPAPRVRRGRRPGGLVVSDLEPGAVASRRAARERALELLYEAETKQASAEEVLAELPVAPAPLAVELVRGVDAH